MGLLIAYQEEDIDIEDSSSFLCVLGHTVLNQDGISVQDHHYVFSPEVVQKKVSFLEKFYSLITKYLFWS